MAPSRLKAVQGDQDFLKRVIIGILEALKNTDETNPVIRSDITLGLNRNRELQQHLINLTNDLIGFTRADIANIEPNKGFVAKVIDVAVERGLVQTTLSAASSTHYHKKPSHVLYITPSGKELLATIEAARLQGPDAEALAISAIDDVNIERGNKRNPRPNER